MIYDERNVVQKSCECMTKYINWIVVAIYRTVVTILVVRGIFLIVPDIIWFFSTFKIFQLIFPILTFIYLYKDFPILPKKSSLEDINIVKE